MPANQSTIQHQKTSPKKPFWRRVCKVCIVLALCGVLECVFAAFTSPRFAVSDVNVSGQQTIPEKQINTIADQLLGQNWLRANRGKVAQELKKNPKVKEVHIAPALHWPPSLNVSVQERQPFAVISGRKKKWLVDKSGVVFDQAPSEHLQHLPKVAVPARSLTPGKALDAAAWKEITTLLVTLHDVNRQAPLAANMHLERVSFDRAGDATLQMARESGTSLEVRLGSSRWNAKLNRVRQTLNYLREQGQQAKVLDFTSYKLATWIPASREDADSRT